MNRNAISLDTSFLWLSFMACKTSVASFLVFGKGTFIPVDGARCGATRRMGSDIIPAILTPGEFVVRRPAVSAFGVDKLEQINRGTYSDGAVYNYNLAVNVKSDSDPNRIARVVMSEIRGIESQRIRSNKL